MIGISQVIQTIGAMIIFSLILISVNRMILQNTMHEVETEAVGVATTIAQSIIKEAQTKAFDEEVADGSIPLKLPHNFSGGGTEESSRPFFDDFDDYDGYTDWVKTKLGKKTFKVQVKVRYVSGPDFNYDGSTAKTMFKKMKVTVTGKYLEEWDRKIRLSYLRRFYKTKDS